MLVVVGMKLMLAFLKVENCSSMQCAVPENIHTPPTKGIGISWGVKGSVRPKKFNDMYETFPARVVGGLKKQSIQWEVWIFSGITQYIL